MTDTEASDRLRSIKEQLKKVARDMTSLSEEGGYTIAIEGPLIEASTLMRSARFARDFVRFDATERLVARKEIS
jgi:hypothetical protein